MENFVLHTQQKLTVHDNHSTIPEKTEKAIKISILSKLSYVGGCFSTQFFLETFVLRLNDFEALNETNRDFTFHEMFQTFLFFRKWNTKAGLRNAEENKMKITAANNWEESFNYLNASRRHIVKFIVFILSEINFFPSIIPYSTFGLFFVKSFFILFVLSVHWFWEKFFVVRGSRVRFLGGLLSQLT